MKIYPIEMSRFMDTYIVGLAYTSVTHFRIRTAFQPNKLRGKGHVLQASNHRLWCSSYLAGKKTGDQAKA
jgi:hypothetical protein